MSSTAIQNFLTNYKDSYVTENTTINKFNYNITKDELALGLLQLTSIAESLQTLSTLTSDCSYAARSQYDKIINQLESKIQYISDTSDILLKINTYYNSNNQVMDVNNYNIFNNTPSVVFDNDQQGLTLESKSSLYQCPSTVVTIDNITTITFHNVNNTYHSGLKLYSPFLSSIVITDILVLNSNGIITQLPIPSSSLENSLYLHFDNILSDSIDIQYYVLEGDPALILSSLKLNLISYTYNNYGSIQFNSHEYKSADLFTVLGGFIVPNNCFINSDVTIELLDINKNSLYNSTLTLPINNSVVCKRLDTINDNDIEQIVGLYINNYYTTSNLTLEELQAEDGVHEKYIVYIPKERETDSINNVFSILNENTIIVKSELVSYFNISIGLELYSFASQESPLITSLTGICKNETIRSK